MRRVRMRVAVRAFCAILGTVLFLTLPFSTGRGVGKIVRRVESSLYSLIETVDAREGALLGDSYQDTRDAKGWRSRG